MLRNFCYVVKDVVAGSALPGDWGNLIDDLNHAREQGIKGIVSLTEKKLPSALLEELGFRYLHLPIEDYEPPAMSQVEQFVRFVNEVKESGEGGTLVHCRAGIGRTGTMLACYLVSQGKSAEEAVGEIRRLRPGSIETRDQERAVKQYEKRVRPA